MKTKRDLTAIKIIFTLFFRKLQFTLNSTVRAKKKKVSFWLSSIIAFLGF